MIPRWVDAGVVLLVLLTLGVAFMFGLFVVWRNGYVKGWRAARVRPPTCPNCGYNLSGLRQTRCPECGSDCTLEELWKSVLR